MIFRDVLLDLPEKGTFRGPERGGVPVLIQRVKNPGAPPRYRQVVIGKVVRDADGREKLQPNGNYYSLNGLTPPAESSVSRRGRPKSGAPERGGKHDRSGVAYPLCVFGIAVSTGLWDVMKRVMGRRLAHEVLALASYYLLRPYRGSLSELDMFMEDNMDFFLEKPLNDSRRVSELFASLDEALSDRLTEEWLKHCVKDDDLLFYDVTSISSWSENEDPDDLAYGHSKDNDGLPQINVGILMSRRLNLPLMHVSYNGSINDGANFPGVMARLRSFEIKARPAIVIDAGFTRDNVSLAAFEGYKVLIRAPHRRYKAVGEAVRGWRSDFRPHPDNSFTLSGRVHSSGRVENFKFGDTEGSLIMVYDPALYSRQLAHFKTVLEEAERAFAENRPGVSYDMYRDWFDIRRKGRGLIWKRRDDEISRENDFLGMTVLFTNIKDKSDAALLADYRAKDSVEKVFRCLKGDLTDGGKMNTGSPATWKGKMTVLFIALILRKRFETLMKGTKMFRQHGVTVSLKRLSRIRMVNTGRGWSLLNPPSADQKELFKAVWTISPDDFFAD